MQSAENSTVPGAGVYFTALPRRMRSSCFSFVSSPEYCTPVSVCDVNLYVSPFSSQSVLTSAFTCLTASFNEKGLSFTVILCSSELLRSNILLTNPRRYSALSPIFSRRCFVSGARSGSLSATVSSPIITFRGVRISWLTLARKALFARLLSVTAISCACKCSFWAMLAVICVSSSYIRKTNTLPPNNIPATTILGLPKTATKTYPSKNRTRSIMGRWSIILRFGKSA